MLGGRQFGGSQGSLRELMMGGYNKNMLCECVKFSKDKFKNTI